MLAVGIGSLQILLDKGQQEDWFSSHLIVGLLVVSALALTAFVIHEMTTEAPVVNLRVFRDRTYATGTFLMTVLGFVLYGSLVLLPIWMQTLLGYPAVVAGIALAPRGLGSFLAMPVVGSLLGKMDPRKFLAFGLVLAALTLLQLGRLDLNAGYWDFFWPQFVQGISLALLFVPLTTVSMGLISKEQMGNATSIFNLLRNTGGSVGIAAVTTLVSRYSQAHINTLVSHVTPYDGVSRGMLEVTQGLMARGSAPAVAAKQGYAALYGMVLRQAAILSFLDIFWLLGLIFLVMVPLVMLMRRPKGGVSVAAH